jgi:glycine dehydrogenase
MAANPHHAPHPQNTAGAATAPPAAPARRFVPRHNSTTDAELDAMVAVTGFKSMDALIDATVPVAIRRKDAMDMEHYTQGMGESEFLDYFK